MVKRLPGGWPTAAFLLLVGTVLAFGSSVFTTTAEAPPSEGPCRAADELPDPKQPEVDCPAPPNTFDVSPFFSADASAEQKALAGPTYDAWAWATFAAMNWPAKEDPGQPTGYQRGVPDPDKSFAEAASTDVLVWETFKEKRELFQPADTKGKSKLTPRSKWQDVTFAETQQPRSPLHPNGIEACTQDDARRYAVLTRTDDDDETNDRVHPRLVSQGSKMPSPAAEDTLDETIEVASQALEAASVLCAGYSDSTKPSLQECQNVFGPEPAQRTPVGPRVWKGNPKDAGARPIYFEVKVNYDFWDYILQEGLYLEDAALDAINSADIDEHPKLPFRTSSATGPGRSPQAVFGYDAAEVAAAYPDLPEPNHLPGIGSVQVKAAWLKLEKGDDPSQYHTTEAVFYRTKPDAPPNFPDEDALEYTCYEVAEFGLLGLHIIQRVHAQPFSRDNPGLFAHGGTFIFATWEHVGLGDYQEKTDYYYANYLAFDKPLAPLSKKFPFDVQTTPFPNFTQAPDGAIPVVREMPYPLETTAKVTQALHDQLPRKSVWRNYRLIGTQFVPVSSEKDALALNQPYYLANLVVETNDGLQKFQGLPPGVDVTPYYTQKVGIRGTFITFERSQPNVIFNRELNSPLNMGGCMGCHGVAQLKGYNFSFVFADGQDGSGLDTQRHFAVAGGQLQDDDGNGGSDP